MERLSIANSAAGKKRGHCDLRVRSYSGKHYRFADFARLKIVISFIFYTF